MLSWKVSRELQKPCWSRCLRVPSAHTSDGSSLRLISCPQTSPAQTYSICRRRLLHSDTVPYLPTCSWLTRSIGLRRRLRLHFSKQWRSVRSRSTAKRINSRLCLPCWQLRTLSNTREHTHYRKLSWIVSC